MNSTALIIIYLLQHSEQFRVNWYSYKKGDRHNDVVFRRKVELLIY